MGAYGFCSFENDVCYFIVNIYEYIEYNHDDKIYDKQMDNLQEPILKLNLAKYRLPITYFPDPQSLWNVAEHDYNTVVRCANFRNNH